MPVPSHPRSTDPDAAKSFPAFAENFPVLTHNHSMQTPSATSGLVTPCFLSPAAGISQSPVHDGSESRVVLTGRIRMLTYWLSLIKKVTVLFFLSPPPQDLVVSDEIPRKTTTYCGQSRHRKVINVFDFIPHGGYKIDYKSFIFNKTGSNSRSFSFKICIVRPPKTPFLAPQRSEFVLSESTLTASADTSSTTGRAT